MSLTVGVVSSSFRNDLSFHLGVHDVHMGVHVRFVGIGFVHKNTSSEFEWIIRDRPSNGPDTSSIFHGLELSHRFTWGNEPLADHFL